MGLINFIVAAILILYVIRFLIRLVLPLFLQGAVNKMNGPYSHTQKQQSKKPEGAISIDYMPPQPKQGNADKLGDFVEYEEIK